jgi:hypothetical protein
MLDILWVIGRIAETIRNFASNVAAYGGITGARVWPSGDNTSAFE